MFHRVARVVLEGFAVLAMAMVVGAALAVWRLSHGPVPLDALLPYVADAIERSLPGYEIRLERAELAWGGWERGLDLRVAGLVVDGPGGVRIADLSAASLRLSRDALLRGRIAPTALVVDGPEFRIERLADGALRVAGLGAEALPLAALAGSGAAADGAALDEVIVSRATIRFVDLASGAAWEARETDLRLSMSATGLRVEARAGVSRAGRTVPLVATYARAADGARAALSLVVDTVAPATIADMLGDVAPAARRLAALSMPLGGRVEVAFDAAGAIGEIRAAVSANGAGVLADPEILPRPAPLEALGVELRYDVARRRLDLDRMALAFAGGGSGELRATLHHDGAGAARIAATAQVRSLPVDSLDRFWPSGLAPYARAWVTRNLSAGTIDEAGFTFSLATDPGTEMRATDLAARLRFRGVTVAYLAPMPVATGVGGTATLALDKVAVATETGAVGELQIEPSRILLSGLDATNERADIELAVRGPVRDQMALLNHPPLGLLKGVGMNPADFGGEATTRARLRFPLLAALRVEQIAVAGTVEAKGFALRRAALGQDVRDGDIAGRFDDKGLSASGRLVLGRTPVEVDYTLGFLSANPVRERIRASGTLPAGELASFGFDPGTYAEGALPMEVDYVARRAGASELRIEAALEDARMAVPEIGWEKPRGVPGSARLELVLERGRLQRIRALRVAAGDADAEGRLVFAADGRTIQSLDLDRLRFGRNDLRVAASRAPDGGWRLRLSGAAGDLAALGDEDPDTRRETPAGRPRIEIDAALGRLWLSEDRALVEVAFSGERAAAWRRAQMTAKGIDRNGRPGAFELDYRTDARDIARLTARTSNAGAMLRSLGITDKVVGGALEASGATDERQPGRPLALDVRMRDYRLVDEPAVARFLSVALLTGLLDLLRGEGIGFDRLEAKVLLDDSDLVIRDLRTSGSALGIQARGRLDLAGERIDLEGTIVPANALNSLFGRIPLIGEVLFGPGLFAARYSVRGPRDAREIVINPLSALTPGFLRNIFGLFEGGNAAAPAPEAPPQR
jgi:hypothetical protein